MPIDYGLKPSTPPVTMPATLHGPALQAPGSTGRAPARKAQTSRRRAWSTAWRMLLATFVGVAASSSTLSDNPALSESALFLLDIILGIIAIALLPLRRSRPLTIALLTTALGAISAFAAGAVLIAAISLATRRRWREIAAVGVGWVVSSVVNESVIGSREPMAWWALVLAGLVTYGLCIVTGLYIGGRRELLATLQDRAETAEREQVARVDQARLTERARIAREMHDVLAHRISLVAMHAGALSYRSDLSREQTAETAEVIRDNAHLAMTELREVLGVLRGTHEPVVGPDRPQPTLDALADLLEECATAASPVTCEIAPQVAGRLGELGDKLSRSAFRILQESLTNSRKHSPGTGVRVEIGGTTGDRLTLMIANAMPYAGSGGPGASGRPGGPGRTGGSPPPGSGLGLIGLVERARLAGGELSYGVEPSGLFVVRAWLPWKS